MYGPLAADEHVEFRQIAVDQPNAQHAHDLLDEEAVVYSRAVSADRSTSPSRGAGSPALSVTSSMISVSLK